MVRTRSSSTTRNSSFVLHRKATSTATGSLFRRQGMVIEHLPVPEQQTGGVPFHAFVVCGEAAGSSVEDKAAEEFLRAAEPPAHDGWGRTDDLSVLYVQGGLQRLKEFKDHIRREIRLLFAHAPVQDDEGPDALKRLLHILGPRPAQDKPHLKSLNGEVVDGRWRIEAEIRMSNRTEGWSFEPFIAFVGESTNERVRWSDLEGDENVEIAGSRVIVRPQGRSKTITVRITGMTERRDQLIPAERAATTLSFRNVSRAEGQQ